jgi:hypothetical protein
MKNHFKIKSLLFKELLLRNAKYGLSLDVPFNCGSCIRAVSFDYVQSIIMGTKLKEIRLLNLPSFDLGKSYNSHRFNITFPKEQDPISV